MAAVISGIWASMTSLAEVDVVNPAKGLAAGQDLGRKIGVPSRPMGLLRPEITPPAVLDGWRGHTSAGQPPESERACQFSWSAGAEWLPDNPAHAG